MRRERAQERSQELQVQEAGVREMESSTEERDGHFFLTQGDPLESSPILS
jgi:hypothetical protein